MVRESETAPQALPTRRTLRLPRYDYASPGAYFITVVTRDRECLFGDISDGEMRLNEAGRVALGVWRDLPSHYPHVELDAFVIMPNHVHGILVFQDDAGVGTGHAGTRTAFTTVGAGLKPSPTRRHGLPEVVRAFKTFSARRVNALRRASGSPLWQRSYYEHIIRDERSLGRIREYVMGNPARWDADRENLSRTAAPASWNPERSRAVSPAGPVVPTRRDDPAR